MLRHDESKQYFTQRSKSTLKSSDSVDRGLKTARKSI